MKKTLIVVALLAGAVSVYSQGQISMNDYNGNFAIQLFTASSQAASTVQVSYGGYTAFEKQGNTAADTNPGNTSYTGAPLGSGYTVGLLAAAGLNVALSGLTPVTLSTTGSFTPITSWGSGNAAGYWNSGEVAEISGTTTTATVAIAAWANTGVDGSAATLAQAQADGYAWGISSPANVSALGSGGTTVYLPATLTSFSLAATPEPSTVALGVIGASAFLMRLRRKA
jgi:hypothetical protein